MDALLLTNAVVLTMDPARPRAGAVAVRDGRVAAVGTETEARGALPPDAPEVDLGGRALVPGFVDPHLHLLSYAASLRSVDCRPGAVRSIADIQEAVRRAAARTPPGRWIRAFGYRESELAERRHPTRWDLDRAAPRHPVQLLHGSGHAVVLNSLALALAGVTVETPEPPGGYLDRDPATGQPTGLLVDMGEVARRAAPAPPEDELAEAVAEASRRLLAAGVTAVQDATATNGPEELACLAGLAQRGAVAQALSVMPGYPAFAAEPGLAAPAPVKLVVTVPGGRLHPPEAELRRQVAAVHAAGRRAAVHAVEREAVAAAADAVRTVLAAAPRPGHGHRVEHASVCPPDLARGLAALGVTVVSNPAFLYESGDRYLAEVAPADLPHLYAVGTLLRAGVPAAAASDAPVAEPLPLRSVAAALTRRSRSGRVLPGERVASVEAALRLVTDAAAQAAGWGGVRGRIAPGYAADLAVLPADPTTADPAELGGWRPALVLVAGRVAWDGASP